jgi:hypothetical protein
VQDIITHATYFQIKAKEILCQYRSMVDDEKVTLQKSKICKNRRRNWKKAMQRHLPLHAQQNLISGR